MSRTNTGELLIERLVFPRFVGKITVDALGMQNINIRMLDKISSPVGQMNEAVYMAFIQASEYARKRLKFYAGKVAVKD